MTNSSVTTGNIIEDIKMALKQEDSLSVSRSLPELIKLEPNRWLTLLYINVIPGPDTKNFQKVIGTLIESMGEAIKTSSIPVNEFVEIIISLLSLSQNFISIRERLEALNLWESPGVNVIFRYAAFLEDQTYLYNKKVQKDVKDRGYYLPTLLYSDNNLSNFKGQADTSLLAGYEINCENLQLTLAYCLYRYGASFFGKPTIVKSPYEDTEFQRLIILATTWRNYKELWGRIKFQGWKPRSYSDNTSALIYIPADMDEFLRSEVGFIRLQQIITELSILFLELPIQHSDTSDLIERTAKSISLPDLGHVWDGQIDVRGFRQAISNPRNSIFGLLMLDYFHYRTLVESSVIGPVNQGISWKNYFLVVNALKILANIISKAAADQILDDHISPALHRVMFVKKEHLINLLVSCSQIKRIECENIIW